MLENKQNTFDPISSGQLPFTSEGFLNIYGPESVPGFAIIFPCNSKRSYKSDCAVYLDVTFFLVLLPETSPSFE